MPTVSSSKGREGKLKGSGAGWTDGAITTMMNSRNQLWIKGVWSRLSACLYIYIV